MDEFREGNLSEEQLKVILKESISVLVKNYKMLLSTNNSLSKEERQRFYNDLDTHVTAIEFITKCRLDEDVLWNGVDWKNKRNISDTE